MRKSATLSKINSVATGRNASSPQTAAAAALYVNICLRASALLVQVDAQQVIVQHQKKLECTALLRSSHTHAHGTFHCISIFLETHYHVKDINSAAFRLQTPIILKNYHDSSRSKRCYAVQPLSSITIFIMTKVDKRRGSVNISLFKLYSPSSSSSKLLPTNSSI